MQVKEQILLSIKMEVQQVLPGAKVILFGSRANDTFTPESDWDILVISNQPITRQIKQAIHDKIFPLDVSIGAFINILLVNRQDWQQNPSWYSLKKNVALNSIVL